MDAKSALTQMTRIAQRRGLDAARLERGLRHNLERLAPLAVEVGLETGDPIGQVLAGLLAEGGNPRLANGKGLLFGNSKRPLHTQDQAGLKIPSATKR